MVNLLSLQRGENITSMIPVRDFDDRQLVMFTQKGTVKKTALAAFGNPKKGGIIAINLDKGDSLMTVRLTQGNQELLIGTRNGKAIRFPETDLRTMGRATRGVRGVSLKGKDLVVGAAVIDAGGTALSVCENGFGKRTEFDDYRIQSRGGQGVINIKTTERNGPVVGLVDVRDEDDIVMITAQGMIIRCPVHSLRTIGRNTQGVKLIALDPGDKLVAIAKVPHEAAAASESDGDENDVDEGPEQ